MDNELLLRRSSTRKGVWRWENISMLAVVLLACLTHIGFFSYDLPFYFEDIEWIKTPSGAGDLAARLINPFSGTQKYGGFDRPLEELIMKGFGVAFGYNPLPFRVVKSIIFLLAVSLIWLWVYRAAGRALWASSTALGTATTLPLLQSVSWICDFEILSGLFVLSAFLLFIHIEGRRDSLTRRQFLLLQTAVFLIAVLANGTKASARVMPMVLLGYLLLWKRKRLKEYALLLLLIGLQTILPIVGSQPHQPFAAWQTKVAELGIQTLHLAGVPLALTIIMLLPVAFRLLRKRTREFSSGMPEGDRFDSAIYLRIGILWLLADLIFWLVLPSGETRYLASVFIPLGICLGIGSFMALSVVSSRAARAVAAIALAGGLAVQVFVNLRLCVYFRGYWGSQFVAADKIVSHVDGGQSNALVLYRYWRPLLYSAKETNHFVHLRSEELEERGIRLIVKDGRMQIAADRPYSRHFVVVGAGRNTRVMARANRSMKLFAGDSGGMFDKLVGASGWRMRILNLGTAVAGDYFEYPMGFYLCGEEQLDDLLLLPRE